MLKFYKIDEVDTYVEEEKTIGNSSLPIERWHESLNFIFNYLKIKNLNPIFKAMTYDEDTRTVIIDYGNKNSYIIIAETENDKEMREGEKHVCR